MKTVPVQQAVGMALAHDLTQIIIGGFEGARFKKGHIVREEDIPVLLSMGKQNLFVLELGPEDVHEEEAARRIAAAVTGPHVRAQDAGEGKVNLYAEVSGVLKVDEARLAQLVDDDLVMLTTLPQNTPVNAGDLLAGTRVIPLYVKDSTVRRAESVGQVLQVLPYQPLRVGVLSTGSEVYNGLIQDKFGPILRQKFAALGCTVMDQLFADDNEQMIADKIRQLRDAGAQLIAVTGGMSVDPDDRTPAGIRLAGTQLESYGAPFLPGSMFLLGYLDGVTVVGLPGCVMHDEFTIFDVLVPRLVAGEHLTRADVKALALGGLRSHTH